MALLVTISVLLLVIDFRFLNHLVYGFMIADLLQAISILLIIIYTSVGVFCVPL